MNEADHILFPILLYIMNRRLAPIEEKILKMLKDENIFDPRPLVYEAFN